MLNDENRKIIHCDADCFFAALEMRDDASLRGIPMAVGGDPFRRGVISTCNYEARRFGVRSALASAYAKKLCPELIIVPHNMKKYRVAAQQLKAIFLDYTDNIEPLSLDEAFLDVTGIRSFSGSATLIAKDIRRRVEQEIGITVSAGIAPNKFLAKVASDWEKPNGLTVVEPSSVTSFLSQLPVSCVPGVGARTQATLTALGVYYCKDLLPFSQVALAQHFGKFGQRLYYFCRGEDQRPVVMRQHRKSMSVEHTLDKDLLPLDCHTHLHDLYQRLTERLQDVSSTHRTHKIFIKIKFMDFSHTTIEMTTTDLNLPLYQSLFKEGCQRYNKAVRLVGLGVRFINNDNNSQKQLDFFTP